ncbi:protein RarD [Corynebacterium sp. CMW7794]|uniref:EamA family transporter RarD n=1 Tax=Corynebacterium phoceense TaxID=1686286 RepID=A0A540RAA4_9CORY|nr:MULTISPECIES: EamA family transporter RarD [Corynebacterium]KXB56073.1 protein RarD [Corynebacterium sp. DNF00584]KXI19128.1 protein RarD [Corynebacterium sp. CMW7794]MBF9010717.1 EamA family transporter RarD [Corynebacterium phoceense]MCQ9330608.1 EamA family transporter RarD [Corynebacterium phoceense]MCQ9347003.1 EamA family transporter RarD [Corynebacterium phoceense]
MFYTIAAYLMWGFFPAFFPLLLPASPLEILAHRVIWTAVLVTGFLVVTGGWRELSRLDKKTWAWLAAAGVFISVNWGTYVVAINSGHVADAALGYFINPLVSVALGLVFLKESLRKLQAVAVGIAAIAVIYLTFFTGQAPYISLLLAFSFGIYGLIKKQVRVSSTGSVAAETLVVLPVALIYVLWLESSGAGTFTSEGPLHIVLLIGSGLVTALPLLCFAQGAKALPLSTVGMLQYMTPLMQMLWALFVTHEHFSTHRWIGFGIIGLAVAVYFTDLIQMAAARRKRSRSAA